MRYAFIIFLLNFIKLCICQDETFTEELFIKPLNTYNVYTHFQFTTKWNVPESGFSAHSQVFPRILGELIERYNVQELHIGLTNGLWRYSKWGYPVINAAPGGEVWTWFKPDTVNVDKNWKELTSSLSGLLCASFNFIDTTNTISPEFSFRPQGVLDLDQIQKVNSSYLKYSSLPQEIVCTENLTPWKKLLPCNAKTGLGSLLNSGFIHNTKYHSLGLHLRRICSDKQCSSTILELQQTISLVYDSKTLGTRNWSLIKFFGQGILSSCELADSSTVYIDITSNSSNPFRLTSKPDEIVTSIRGGTVSEFAKYEVKNGAFSVGVDYSTKQELAITKPPALYAHQYLSGYGKESGGLVVKISNNHWSHLDVIVLQNIPWYLQVYLHTLKTSVGSTKLKPIQLKFKPGKLRTRYHQLELLLRIPAKSVATVSVNFDYTFLKWQEYPPDANHGFYVGSAIVSCHLPLARDFTGLPQDGSMIRDTFNASRSGYLVQIRTETLIVTLPTPDFSMPYNVICLACTVVALAFGPLHNITTKRFILKVKDERKLIDKIKSKLNLLWNKKEESKE